MAVNKVVINDEVVLDLTGDTVRAADLPKGVIAHSATGAKVTGTTNYAGSSNAGGGEGGHRGSKTCSLADWQYLHDRKQYKPRVFIWRYLGKNF